MKCILKKLRTFALIFILLNYSNSIEANIETHFRKIDPFEKNASPHSFGPIDFIYLINLDYRTDKLEWSLAQLEEYGISPYRFSAIKGQELTYDAISDIGVKFKPWMRYSNKVRYYPPKGDKFITLNNMEVGKTYYSDTLNMNKGAIGCAMSHLSIMQDALDSGYELIWILEDDIIVRKDPAELISLIHHLDKKIGRNNWDILFTDQHHLTACNQPLLCNQYAEKPNYKHAHPKQATLHQRIDNYLYKIGSRFGTHSMIITRSGLKKLLNYIKQYGLFNPIDWEMTQPPGMNLYTVVNDVVGNAPHWNLSSDLAQDRSSHQSKN